MRASRRVRSRRSSLVRSERLVLVLRDAHNQAKAAACGELTTVAPARPSKGCGSSSRASWSGEHPRGGGIARIARTSPWPVLSGARVLSSPGPWAGATSTPFAVVTRSPRKRRAGAWRAGVAADGHGAVASQERRSGTARRWARVHHQEAAVEASGPEPPARAVGHLQLAVRAAERVGTQGVPGEAQRQHCAEDKLERVSGALAAGAGNDKSDGVDAGAQTAVQGDRVTSGEPARRLSPRCGPANRGPTATPCQGA
jgi:hypothetical protein